MIPWVGGGKYVFEGKNIGFSGQSLIIIGIMAGLKFKLNKIKSVC